MNTCEWCWESSRTCSRYCYCLLSWSPPLGHLQRGSPGLRELGCFPRLLLRSKAVCPGTPRSRSLMELWVSSVYMSGSGSCPAVNAWWEVRQRESRLGRWMGGSASAGRRGQRRRALGSEYGCCWRKWDRQAVEESGRVEWMEGWGLGDGIDAIAAQVVLIDLATRSKMSTPNGTNNNSSTH
jgi:hypothetical protein